MNDPEKPSPDDAWLDTCLEERIGELSPPDLRSRILTCADRERSRPTAMRSKLAAAAILVLGASVALAVWAKRGASTASPAAGPVRVLYVESEPTWRYRHLKNVLLRGAPEIEAQIWLGSADATFAQEHSAGLPALAALPTPDALGDYDVVVLGAVDVKHLGASAEERKKWFAALAASRCGVAFVRGSRELFGLSSLSGFPFAMASSGGDRARAGRVQLTRDHAVTRLRQHFADSLALWSSFGPFEDLHALPASDGPEVLLQAAVDRPWPVAVVAERSSGRLLALGIGDLWRMRATDGGVHYAAFWRNAVRWLAGR